MSIPTSSPNTLRSAAVLGEAVEAGKRVGGDGRAQPLDGVAVIVVVGRLDEDQVENALAVRHRCPLLAVAPIDLLHEPHAHPCTARWMPATILQPRQAFAPLPRSGLHNPPYAMPQSHNRKGATNRGEIVDIGLRGGRNSTAWNGSSLQGEGARYSPLPSRVPSLTCSRLAHTASSGTHGLRRATPPAVPR